MTGPECLLSNGAPIENGEIDKENVRGIPELFIQLAQYDRPIKTTHFKVRVAHIKVSFY